MIRFSKYIWVYAILSSLILVPGTFVLLRWGLRSSIDFTGGTVLEVKSQNSIPKEEIEKAVKTNNIDLVDWKITNQHEYTFRMKTINNASIDAFRKTVAATGGTIEVLKQDTVGPIVGKELLSKAVTASILSIIVILCFVAYAFKNLKFGISAIIALIHDVLVVFGSFALLGHFFGVEVDTLFVTAFLTTMSFSVHDTIVIFDRIRELRKRDTKSPLDLLSDVALTEVAGRSLVTSFTIIFMLFSLVLIGGESIRWFAVALLIGTITGAYSSLFVATPVLLFWDALEKRKK